MERMISPRFSLIKRNHFFLPYINEENFYGVPTSFTQTQGIGDVSSRSEMPMTNGYHGRVATYSEYQKKNTRKNSIEGLAFNCSLCGLHSDFSP